MRKEVYFYRGKGKYHNRLCWREKEVRERVVRMRQSGVRSPPAGDMDKGKGK